MSIEEKFDSRRFRPANILLIDSCENILPILKGQLENCGHHVTCSVTGMAAVKMLTKDDCPIYEVILINANIGDMDSLDLLMKIKFIPGFKNTPILFTNAIQNSKLVEKALVAGASYCLNKSTSYLIISILIESVVSRSRSLVDALTKLKSCVEFISKLERCDMNFRTLEDISLLAPIFAEQFPKPSMAVVGIIEMMVNAVEHGNLEINGDEKKELVEAGIWNEEVRRRLTLPEFSSRVARIEFFNGHRQKILTITDSGPGFNWKPYFTDEPKSPEGVSSRGILLARAIGFDQVEYNEKGNKVSLTCNIYQNG